ncbi:MULTISPECIES: capsular biosynthesis protein [unclassified Novosphingobium]|uniref:capsular polysaccharide export protein, LipB/KpsS family n=1 Tax=unclassified Novosphingobium TaxID=2644732 RepID=UPI00146C047E|nr:capsular polysaccharide export protein [Novosphingobium sp. SG919]NMN89266.1 capsular polysaccharide export protein [Novosphingobium sp. SG916]
MNDHDRDGWAQFAGKRILLLQGPVGPFFAHLARDLRAAGAQVWKVNFHAGDQVFFPGGITWRGQMADWPAWLEQQLDQWQIDCVLLFGDCRPVHQGARAACARLGVAVGVFEEGYLRPHHVTFEWGGVNADSALPREAAGILAVPASPASPSLVPVPATFWRMAWWAVLYFAVGALLAWRFPHYVHHRPLALVQALPWLRSAWRKPLCALAQRGMLARLTGPASGRWFMVPLQVHNDSQVLHHAATGGVAGFIASTIASFARHAPPDCLLVIKHHPMDRGYRDYRAMVADEAARHGCAGRVRCLHDQPTLLLLQHCRGVITINSTVGLSALAQGRATKAVGTAFYDIPGLTYQGPLHRFWHEAPLAVPDPALWRRFHALILARAQINGSFYRRVVQGTATGLAQALPPPPGWAAAAGWRPMARPPVPLTGSSIAPPREALVA